MKTNDDRTPADVSPVQTLMDLALGYVVPRCLHVMADLGVADVLGDSPRTAAELAADLNVEADALGRVLRLLAAHGVFAIRGEAFTQTPTSCLLRTNNPQSMRAFVRMLGLPMNWASYETLLHTVRTGRSATTEVHPRGSWAYLAEHPEAGAILNAAMSAKATDQIAGVLSAYDFSNFGTIADIGGGRGHLLRAILEAAPRARGVLFDLPQVIEDVRGLGLERISLHSGDFFQDALPACDLYLLMEVIHDWPDREALAILQAIHRAAPPHARVLLIEQLIPDQPGPHWAKTLDIHMLVLNGGGQRSRQQYEILLDSTGFTLQREIYTGAGVAILEARLSSDGQIPQSAP
jgi:hypothetical protein